MLSKLNTSIAIYLGCNADKKEGDNEMNDNKGKLTL
jgi:hypothetical protein